MHIKYNYFQKDVIDRVDILKVLQWLELLVKKILD